MPDDDNNQINSNNYGPISQSGDAYQYIYSNLNVSPKQIILYAKTDIKPIQLFLVLGIVFSILAAVEFFVQEFKAPIIISSLFGILMMIVLSTFALKKANEFNFKNGKFRSWYCDGAITLRAHGSNGKPIDINYKFYEDIWKIEYKTNFFDNGVLSFYLIDRKDHKPIKKVIVFKSAAEACYIYDSFYDQERIKAFLEQKDQSTTSI